MSHLACADELGSGFTGEQLERFVGATEGFDGPRSLANSAAILAWPDTHFDWVRPGRYVSGPEFAAAGLAEMVDIVQLAKEFRQQSRDTEQDEG